MLRRGLVVCLGALLAVSALAQQPAPAGPAALYEGALFIPGDGGAPIGDSAFLTRDGTIAGVGKRGAITPPPGTARVDLRGKVVMPALINGHGHPAFQLRRPGGRRAGDRSR